MKLFENMRNPRVNRVIGYAVLFAGFIFFGAGFVLAKGITAVLGIAGCVFGILLCIAATVWMIMKVRCPHCNQLLHIRLYDISRCQYCGKSTDPDSRQ